jgi:hypothetical protein
MRNRLEKPAMWQAFRDRHFARRMRARLGGLRRAEYWRRLGFPNLTLARARKAEKQAERKEIARQRTEVRIELENTSRLLQSTMRIKEW